MAATSESAEKSRLEAFDGSDPSLYKNWRRRAKLMLAALPSTISKEKYGARLMEHIRGEAEALLETLEVEVIVKEGGDENIFKMLDDKYLPMQRDLLQSALKLFFYDLSVKPGENYAQFITRFDTSLRKLKEQQIELPEIVKGFMFIKKLRLDSAQESLVLTATGGSLECSKVITAVRSVFPEGKGPSKSSREVFMTEMQNEDPQVLFDLESEIQEAMEVVANEAQTLDEEEDALEVFETYAQVRKKIMEQKKSRGFNVYQKSDPEKWRLKGTVQGRLEMIKSRTRCHRCHQRGHWKRECPMKNQASGSDGKVKPAASEVLTAEVVVLQEKDNEQVWELFQTEAVEKNVSWKKETANDVGNSGFADTHSTGNRQRQHAQRDDRGIFEPRTTSEKPHVCKPAFCG